MNTVNDALNTPSTVSRNYLPWISCFSAALFFFYEFIQANMFNSIAQDVMRDLHIQAGLYGWLSSVYYTSNVIFLFPAGIILDRFSTKKIILVAMILCVGGTFVFSMASNFHLALICRFLTGIGSAFCFLSCVRLATRWFPADKMALVTGLLVTMAMTGGMVSQWPLTLLVEHVGWRMAIVYDGILGALIILLILAYVQDAPDGSPEQDVLHKSDVTAQGFWQSLRCAYFNSQNILAAVFTSLMNMPVAILGAMAGGLYLVQAQGFTRTEASLITSMIFVGTIIGGPLIGWYSDRIGVRKKPMIIGNLAAMLVMMLILYISSASLPTWLVLFFLLGFFTSAQVVSYPLVAENNSLAFTATAVSVVSIMTMGGYIVYQNLFASLLQYAWTGAYSSAGVALYSAANFHHALLIIPYGFIIALLAVFFLKETHCRRKY